MSSLSRSIWSMNSVTVGRTSSLASRRPPIMLGLTVELAPARIILGAASGAMTLETMRAAPLRLRAERVTKRLSLSSVSAAITPMALVIPAWVRIMSSVASPTT